jgi:hypothetical protein
MKVVRHLKDWTLDTFYLRDGNTFVREKLPENLHGIKSLADLPGQLSFFCENRTEGTLISCLLMKKSLRPVNHILNLIRSDEMLLNQSFRNASIISLILFCP